MWAYCSNLAAAARMTVVVGVVAVFDLVESIDVDGIETMSVGRPRLVEVGEVGYIMVGSKLAGVWSERKRVSHRLVEGRTRL